MENFSAGDSVVPGAMDYSPYAASRIFNVTFSAWDQMNMTVKDSLPGGFPAIDSDVESRYLGVLTLNMHFRLSD